MFVFVPEATTNYVGIELEDNMVSFRIQPKFWLIRRDEEILRRDQILRVGSWGQERWRFLMKNLKVGNLSRGCERKKRNDITVYRSEKLGL